MKLVLRITSVFDENKKMHIRNIPTLFWYMLYRDFHFFQLYILYCKLLH